MGSKNNRAAGIRFELRILKDLKKAGFTNAKTSRLASREMDAMGVDFVGTPGFYIQAKRYLKTVPYRAVLSKMPLESGGIVNVVIHGKRRLEPIVCGWGESMKKILMDLSDEESISAFGKNVPSPWTYMSNHKADIMLHDHPSKDRIAIIKYGLFMSWIKQNLHCLTTRQKTTSNDALTMESPSPSGHGKES